MFQETQQSFNDAERYQLQQRMLSGGRWFYWIAALSLVTSVISLSGGQWGFFISLGVTQVMDGLANALAQDVGGTAKVFAILFDLIAVGVFAAIGYFACRGNVWAFAVGMVLYLLDAVFFILARHWLGLAFHAFALYSMYNGLQAGRRLKELDAGHGAPAMV